MSKKWHGIDKAGTVTIGENLVTISGFEFTALEGANAPLPIDQLHVNALRWALARIQGELVNLTHNVAGKIGRS